MLGLKVSANNYRTNVVTVNIFTPCASSAKAIRITLTLIHKFTFKFNPRSTQRCRNCAMLRFTQFVLMEQMCDTILCFNMFSESKGDYHKRNQCSSRKTYLYYIAKRYDVIFCIFTQRRRKRLSYLESLESSDQELTLFM